MLTDAIKQEIRDRLDAISKAMPGFRSRPAQRLMIAEVAKTLAKCKDPGSSETSQPATPDPSKTTLVVQGGTGTGKSLGYGLAGMVLARHKGKKLIISSSTISLQEQLTFRDLPFFQRAAGLPGDIELAKGRTRYVCIYKLKQALADMEQISMFDREERAGDREDSEEIRKMVEAMAVDFEEGRWNGDRDLRQGVNDDIWKHLTTDRHGCLNRACPAFRNCAQIKARKRVKEAAVVVVNHDLLLSDLAMGGGKILPPPSECFYVIDEAHSIPEKAVASFASSHFINAERRSAEKLANLASAISNAIGKTHKTQAESIREDAGRLKDYLGDAYSYFDSLSQLKPSRETPRPTLEFPQSCVPDGFHEIGDNIKNLSNSLCGLLEDCQKAVADLLGTDKASQALHEKLLADMGFYKGRMGEVYTTWSLFLQEPVSESAPPVAKWIEAVKFKSSIDFHINASPVVASGYLRNQLWEKAAGVILTSATITTMGSFDDFLRRTGLSNYEVTTIDLPSPFDYETQGVIDIPAMPNPKDYDKHTAALVDLLTEELEEQGAEGVLVLFTSRRQMEDVANRLPKNLRERCLLQGELSKRETILEHCRRIDAGKPSVIFGLSSYTEGVDLPGKFCSKVVVTKLPFQVPDSPVLRALSDWIERRGGNPFLEISCADAGRKLEQAVGRLIRTEADHGRVVITDPRLWDTRYGRAILKGLPPFRVIAKGKEVRV